MKADIVAFGAHPDDLEFAVGASLIKFVDSGYKTAMIVLTKGEKGTQGNPALRVKEAETAAKKIGCLSEIMDFEDCKIVNDYNSRIKIAKIIRKYRPHTVLAPYHTNIFTHRDGAAHFDHSAAGSLVRDSLRMAKFSKILTNQEPHFADYLFYYMVPRNKVPTLINDVSSHYKKWVEIAQVHKSQMSLRKNMIELLTLHRRYYGSMIGVKYGEAFISDEPLRITEKFVFKP